MKTRFYFLISLLLAFSYRVMAADCTLPNISNGASYYTANLSGFKPPEFDPSAYSVGQVIYSADVTSTITNSNGDATFTCSTMSAMYRSGIGNAVNNIYPTSINGIGVRMYLISDNRYWPAVGSSIQENVSYGFVSPTTEMRVELVKTGDITAGGQLYGPFAKYTEGSPDGQILLQHSWNTPVIIRPQVPSCTVTNTNIVVGMPPANASTFSGVGSYSSASPFNIQLSCSGGATSTSTNAYVTLTDNTNPGNVSTTLTLSPETNTAQGVGIQLLFGSTILGYGPDSAAPGNTNQWAAGNIQQGVSTFTIPLSARYVQTEASIKPGAANAVATFTMSYQ